MFNINQQFFVDRRKLKVFFKKWLDTEKLVSFPVDRDNYGVDDIDSIVNMVYKGVLEAIAPISPVLFTSLLH